MRTSIVQTSVHGVRFDIELLYGKVWRITTADPLALTIGGVRVGMQVRELPANDLVDVVLGPGGNAVIVSTSPCGLSYPTDYFPEGRELLRPLDIKTLRSSPESIRIMQILAIGCR